MKRIISSCFIAALIVLHGCSEVTGPKTMRVWGDVSYDGKPIENGSITFESTDGGSPAQGQIKAGLFDVPSESGLVAEKTYLVKVNALTKSGKTIRNVPLNGFSGPDWARRATARYYEEKKPRAYPVDSGLALHLITSLVDREFDPVSSDALPEGKGEGHAFAFVRKRLMEDPTLPVVPVFINTYFPPNQPTPRRCYKLGQAIREAVENYPGSARVGIVGSGGLSHFVVDEDLDRGVLDACARKDAEMLQSLPRHKLNSGSSEIRMWICVAGAVEHLDFAWSRYVPGYRTPAGSGTGLGFALWS